MTTNSSAPLVPRINVCDIKASDMKLIHLISEPCILPQNDVIKFITDNMVSLKAELFMVLINRKAVKNMLCSLSTIQK